MWVTTHHDNDRVSDGDDGGELLLNKNEGDDKDGAGDQSVIMTFNKCISDAGSAADFRILFEIFEILEIFDFFWSL